MANPNTTPVQSQIQLYSGAAWQQKFSPNGSSGSAFDFTAYATTPVLALAPQQTIGAPLTPVTPTVIAHDNTGITLGLAATDIAAILTELKAYSQPSAQYSFSYGLTVNNVGGDVALVAQGNGGIKTSPLDF